MWVSINSQWLDSHKPCRQLYILCLIQSKAVPSSGRSYMSTQKTQWSLWSSISVYSTILGALFMFASMAHHCQLRSDEIKSLPTLWSMLPHLFYPQDLSVTKPRLFKKQKSSLLTDAVTPQWPSHSQKDWDISTTRRRLFSDQEYPAPLSQVLYQRGTFSITPPSTTVLAAPAFEHRLDYISLSYFKAEHSSDCMNSLWET